jgi:hypothetical protein
MGTPRRLFVYRSDSRASSIRIFAGYTAILDACEDAWQKLLAETGRITSIADRGWATVGQSF